MKSFAEKERVCEMEFEAKGPFWHVCTDGNLVSDIFRGEDEFKEGMTVLAVSAVLFKDAELLTFELMNNHVHLIMRGEEKTCIEFFELFKKRLKRWFQGKGRPVDWNRFVAQILKIDTLKALRNEIAYVNRNGYVANHDYTPFSYPWGGGCAYFSPIMCQLPATPVREIGVRKVRGLTHYRDVDDLAPLSFVGDVPFVPSFCRIDIGQSMFRDARNYFQALTKNAEAFSLIASRLKDSVFLTDDEMFVLATTLAEETFSSKLRLLNPEQKIQLARKLHYEYNASNAQLRRLLSLDLTVLNELFPPLA